jgi:hypothetical protein
LEGLDAKNIGIFYGHLEYMYFGHLEYYTAFWYIFLRFGILHHEISGIFSYVLVYCITKYLATLLKSTPALVAEGEIDRNLARLAVSLSLAATDLERNSDEVPTIVIDSPNT